jgi:hypothetical protein
MDLSEVPNRAPRGALHGALIEDPIRAPIKALTKALIEAPTKDLIEDPIKGLKKARTRAQILKNTLAPTARKSLHAKRNRRKSGGRSWVAQKMRAKMMTNRYMVSKWKI